MANQIQATIALIDDEADLRWVLRRILVEDNYAVVEAENGTDGLKLIEKGGIDFVFLDLKMPGMDGMDLLKIIHEKFPDMVVVVLTAHGDVSQAVEATKLGAFDFMIKPVSEERIKVAVKNGLERHRLQSTVERLEGRLPPVQTGPIIGQSPAVKKALELVTKVAPTDLTVLLIGESGTGKELFASMIHRSSLRANKPFIAVDGGAFPESLAESELFGYEKGSFTGAERRRLGKFELAHEGTLFLDEIGNMTLDVQSKILRALEQKKIYRVGGRTLIPVDARIVAATNADMEDMVKNNRFREDLFYRLNAFTIEIPPLRERIGDIKLLIEYFVSLSQWACDHITISDEAMCLLTNYDWPGNIRQLKNCIDRALLICSGTIKPEDLPSQIQTSETISSDHPDFKSLKEAGDWGARLEEEKIIRKTLEQTGGNRGEAADILGIDVKTLYNKIKKYQINPYQDKHDE
ncbi:sigma-54-dependent Fis family transcriptional regulator [bacterium]|nr:sigma-54-dependent Fis family transcriptional regulator [bacterium]